VVAGVSAPRIGTCYIDPDTGEYVMPPDFAGEKELRWSSASYPDGRLLVRNNNSPQPGDYGVVRTGGIIARLIRLVTRSRYNHAFVIVSNAGWIIESARKGARRSDLSAYANEDVLFSHECLDATQRSEVVTQAWRSLHVPYGFADVVWLGLAQYGLKWRKAIDKRDDLVCSQLVAVCYEAAGIRLSADPECTTDVTPGDLARRIETRAGCGWKL
jgi:hypothetical protein